MFKIHFHPPFYMYLGLKASCGENLITVQNCVPQCCVNCPGLHWNKGKQGLNLKLFLWFSHCPPPRLPPVNIPWKPDRQHALRASLTSDLDEMSWQIRRWVISLILVIHSSSHLPASSDNFPVCTYGDYAFNQQDCTDSLCLIADSLWSLSKAN